MTSLRLGLALSGWAALAVVTFLPDALILRVVVTTAFLIACPGLAASRRARAGTVGATDRTAVLEGGVLAVTVSLSMAVLVAVPLFLSDAFTVTRALLALAAATTVLALMTWPGGHRRRAPRVTPDADPGTADPGRPELPASD
ncbi:hypothetical protein ACWERY_11920 [Streptomyces sp. NPDC004082]|uniref:hypothetical protein n=1 Tax=Streptomyces sp. NPDC005301 TaxID=3156874 RepID=UPI0033BE58B4